MWPLLSSLPMPMLRWHSDSFSSYYLNNIELIQMAYTLSLGTSKKHASRLLFPNSTSTSIVWPGEKRLIMFIQTSSMSKEQPPSPTLDNQTTSLCTSSKPTPPSEGKMYHSHRFAVLPPSNRTALPAQSGVFLKIWAWTHTLSLSSSTTGAV